MTKYSIISTEKRQKLINAVIQLNLGIVRTAKKLKIKLSTAKSILRAFKSKGKILKKKHIKRKRNIKPKTIKLILNQETSKIDEIVQQLLQKKQEKTQNIQKPENFSQFYSNYYFNFLNWIPITYPFCF